MDIRHKNPLMSVSLSEYWGLRWNPVVCKLLQGAFYKPLRRAGASQIACVLACFAGSAALHALPVYMGTFDGPETVMMGFFFLGNGLLVLFEQVFAALVGWADKQGKSRPRAEAAAAAAPASPVRPAAGAGAPAGAVTEPRPSDPRASSRVMSNVPYVGELFLLSGVCGLFYAGAAAGGPIAALATHTGTVAASLGLLTVAMGCVWYTQWVFGKFDAEVGVMWGVGRGSWVVGRVSWVVGRGYGVLRRVVATDQTTTPLLFTPYLPARHCPPCTSTHLFVLGAAGHQVVGKSRLAGGEKTLVRGGQRLAAQDGEQHDAGGDEEEHQRAVQPGQARRCDATRLTHASPSPFLCLSHAHSRLSLSHP
jgi:hypothetical protein